MNDQRMIGAKSIDAMIAEIRNGNLLTAPAGFTTRDLAGSLKCSNHSAGRILRTLFDAGAIEMCGKRKILAMDGKLASAPVYRLKKKS